MLFRTSKRSNIVGFTLAVVLSILLGSTANAAEELPPPLLKRATHYETFGLSLDASEKAIKDRFRELARTYFADHYRNASRLEREAIEESAKILNEAYGILGDPAARAKYNWSLPAKDHPLSHSSDHFGSAEPVNRNTYYDFWSGPPDVFLGTQRFEKMPIGKSYYDTLGLSQHASEAEIGDALRQRGARLDWSNFIAEDGQSCTLDKDSFRNVIEAQRQLGFIRDALLKEGGRRKYDTWLNRQGGFPDHYYKQPYESTMDPDDVAASYRFIPRDIRAMVRFLNRAPKNTTIVMDSARAPSGPLSYLARIDEQGKVDLSTKVWGASTLIEKNGKPWISEFELDHGALRLDQKTRAKPFFLGKRIFDRMLLVWSFGFWPGEEAAIDDSGYLRLGPQAQSQSEKKSVAEEKSKSRFRHKEKKARTAVPYVLSQEENIDEMAALMSAFGFGGSAEIFFGDKKERYHVTMGIPPHTGSGAAQSSDQDKVRSQVIATKDLSGDLFGRQYFHMGRVRGGLKLVHEELVLTHKLKNPNPTHGNPAQEISVDRKYLVGLRGKTTLAGESIMGSTGPVPDLDGSMVSHWFQMGKDQAGDAEAWHQIDQLFNGAVADAVAWRKERDLPPLKERIILAYKNTVATAVAVGTGLKEVGGRAVKFGKRLKSNGRGRPK